MERWKGSGSPDDPHLSGVSFGVRLPREISLPRAIVPLALVPLLLVACRIETRPPAGVGQTRATIQEAVLEHYRARGATDGDSGEYQVLRRQADVRKDLASVWVTLRESEHLRGGAIHDTTLVEHLLLRRSEEGWIVLSATKVGAP